MTNKLEEYELQLDRQENLEHRDVLLAIGSIIKTDQGRKLFKYLFKTLSVTLLPESHMEGKILHEYLGLLKAGNAVYKLACEADFEVSALLLSKLERERYEQLCERYRIELESTNTED